MKPLLYFDIETTGTDIAKDRIVSLAFVKVSGEESFWSSFLFNPGFEMREEVIAVHGITNEMAAAAPAFAECASEVAHKLDGCDLAGFNLLNFDVPLLWEEFYRAGLSWDLTGVHILDAGNIFKKMEPRTLASALLFYLGREHSTAHDALGDTLATQDVLNAQLARYPELQGMDRAQLAEFSRFDDRVDLAGKIIYNADREAVYNLGKSKGVRVVDDPGFGYWMLDRDFPQQTKHVLKALLGGRGGSRTTSSSASNP